MHMTCNQCGSLEVIVVESSGGIKHGSFREKHECQMCGATGTVSGQAEAPASEWNRYGGVFNGNL